MVLSVQEFVLIVTLDIALMPRGGGSSESMTCVFDFVSLGSVEVVLC